MNIVEIVAEGMLDRGGMTSRVFQWANVLRYMRGEMGWKLEAMCGSGQAPNHMGDMA